jgi:anti-anti-sigma regulatory factor
MKIALSQKEGVSILSVTGVVDMHSFTVLKAGITKLLRDGKNRIALDLSASEKLDTEVIREIAILDILARELAGRIALIVSDAAIRQTITSFSRPPIVPIVDSQAQLIQFFEKAGKEDAEEPKEQSQEAKELKRLLKAKEQELAALQALSKPVDQSELNKLRQDTSSAAGQYKALLVQVKEMLLERRVPVIDSAAIEKIAALESENKELSDRLKAATKGAT